jgi:rod shape-determining protein MreB
MFSIFRSEEPQVAVDLGTKNILVCDFQKVVYQQQNVAACAFNSKEKNKSYVVGEVAEDLVESNPETYQIIKPLRKGVISDFENCREIVNCALKSSGVKSFFRPSVLVSVPLDVTDLEKEIFKEVFLKLGHAHVSLVAEPVAAAVGLVKDFLHQKGVFLVDVGAGITEAAVFSMGGVVCNHSARIGGEDFEVEIKAFIRKRYNFEIGSRMAQFLLNTIAEDHPDSYLQPIEIKGFDLNHRVPSTLRIELQHIYKALDAFFNTIARVVMQVLEQTPEELSSEILDRGIYLTGGASQYKRLVLFLEEQTGLKVFADAQALLGVARGEVALLQNPKLRKELQYA